MTLITCPDCHNEISDAAPSCPRCGRPGQLHQAASPTAQLQPRVIEETGKKWKGLQAIGCAGTIVGFVLTAVGAHQIFALIAVLALCTYVYGRWGAWWHHR